MFCFHVTFIHVLVNLVSGVPEIKHTQYEELKKDKDKIEEKLIRKQNQLSTVLEVLNSKLVRVVYFAW